MEKRNKSSIKCNKCGNAMKSVFSNMERTYAIFACAPCHMQRKETL